MAKTRKAIQGRTKSRRRAGGIGRPQPANRAARSATETSANFCAAARDALKHGEPDAISDEALQEVLTAAVKVYAAKVEKRGHDVEPFPRGTVTATETVVTACGLIRAADLNMFDVAIWFHRPPGIE